MADLVKVSRTSTAGQGVSRTDGLQGQKGSYSSSTQGLETTTQTNPETIVNGESTPGDATTTSTETSPERRTTETRLGVVNRKVEDANQVRQTQGEQKTERVVREDAGIQISFKMRISSFL